jgi:hypothetical protein
MVGILSSVFFFGGVTELLEYIIEDFLCFVDSRAGLMQVIKFDAAVADFGENN